MGILAKKKVYHILGTVTTLLKKKDYKQPQAMQLTPQEMQSDFASVANIYI